VSPPFENESAAGGTAAWERDRPSSATILSFARGRVNRSELRALLEAKLALARARVDLHHRGRGGRFGAGARLRAERYLGRLSGFVQRDIARAESARS
jgi:hypothetical protein